MSEVSVSGDFTLKSGTPDKFGVFSNPQAKPLN